MLDHLQCVSIPNHRVVTSKQENDWLLKRPFRCIHVERKLVALVYLSLMHIIGECRSRYLVFPNETERFERLVVQNAEILEKIRKYKIPAAALADDMHQTKINENYEFSFDVDSPERPFEKPVVFLLGRHDSMVGYRDALKVIEHFPRATFAVLDRAGHSLSWEQPELFNALATDWIQRVEEYD